jgi:hypothetical protein
LSLAPRSAAASEVSTPITPTGASPFGNAAPRDQAEIERKIEERRLEREAQEKEVAAAKKAESEKPKDKPRTSTTDARKSWAKPAPSTDKPAEKSWRRPSEKSEREPNFSAFGAKNEKENAPVKGKDAKEGKKTQRKSETENTSASVVNVTNAFALLGDE